MSSTRRTDQGLRKLSPEMLAQAQDQTLASVTRITLTLVGVCLYCFLSLFAPDASLLRGEERLFDIPFAGPVSFRGFLLIGPLIVIALLAYLHIYDEHWRRLEKIRGRLPRPIQPPALAPMKNPFLRLLYGMFFMRYCLS